MLTPKQITEVEAVYICRNFDTINDDIFALLIERFYDINLEQFIYLKWLLTRWPLLRKHRLDMPTRIIYLPRNRFK
jgi:hypothetical protein